MLSTLLGLQLPGWPAVPEVTPLDTVMVTVLFPLAIAAVITAVVMGPGWRSE